MATSFENYIYNCYNQVFAVTDHFWSIDRTISNCSPFHKYMKVSLDKDTIEIPCMYKYMVTTAIKNINNTQNPIDTLYIPMFYGREVSVEAKSSNPLIKTFFYDGNEKYNLIKRTGNGTVYIGGPGILLYNDYTPLAMLTLEVKKFVDDMNYTKLMPLRQLIRINPVIYTKDDLLAKFIRNKFLINALSMKLTEEDYRFYHRAMKYKFYDKNGLFVDTKLMYDFEVIIKDFSDFFYTPEVPDVTFTSDKANEILEDNLTNILAELQ